MSKYSAKYEEVAKMLLDREATDTEVHLAVVTMKIVKSEFDELRFRDYLESERQKRLRVVESYEEQTM